MSTWEEGDANDRDPITGGTIESVLLSFDKALTLVATATSALEAALDSTVIEDCAEPSEKIDCLRRGVNGLRCARIAIADALRGRR
jgi:hypothetical protein